MNEKPKQGLGEEAKSGFISCALTLLILVSIPTICIFATAWYIFSNFDAQAQAIADKIEPTIRETCNLPAYQADGYYLERDDWVLYYHHIESEGLIVTCYPTNDGWQCSCTPD